MLKFSKIFLLCLIIVLGGCCAFFFTAEKEIPIELLEAEESIEYETETNLGYDCLMAESSGSSQSSVVYQNVTPYTNDTLVIEVVLINFNDWAVFSVSNYSNFFQKLEAVADYFETVSRGELIISFNINICNLDESISSYINQEVSYYVENQLYLTCLANSVPVGDNHGEAQVRFLVFSAGVTFLNTTSMFWPHAYPTVKFMVMNSSTEPSVICHETYHTLGLLDLYIGNNNIAWYESITQSYFKPVSATDIMASGYNLDTPTSAYNRYLLSWLDLSEIQTIGSSNRYTINEAMQTSGTIAYKFGVNGNEFFMIECRKVGNQNYLIVQRINTAFNQNINAQDHSTCYIYSFPSKSNSLYFGEGDTLGTASGELYYANGIDANFSIGNIVDLGNNQFQFDFFTSADNSMQKTLNITDKHTNQVITNATVKINDQDVTSNTISIKEGDEISVTHENYKPINIIVTGKDINLTSGNIDIQMEDINYTDATESTFQLDLILDGVQDFVLNNNISVFINNILMQFHNTITLKNGDILKIASGNNQTYNSTYSNGTLSDNSGNTVISNNTIQITLNPATCNYYLNVKDSNNEFVNITSLYLFNNFTKEWDFYNNISVVYVNGLKVYALNNVPFYYTQVKVNYASYNTTASQMAYINVGTNFYNIQLNKNIIQNTGDFIFGIANNIKNWFA